MKTRRILSTIFYLFLITKFLPGQALATNGGILITRAQAQALKNEIEFLRNKNEKQAEIIAGQDIMIGMLQLQTNQIMAMANNRIGYSENILRQSDIFKTVLKKEKKRSLKVGLAIGLPAGAILAGLFIKSIAEIQNLRLNSRHSLRYPNLKRGAPQGDLFTSFNISYSLNI